MLFLGDEWDVPYLKKSALFESVLLFVCARVEAFLQMLMPGFSNL